MLDMYCLVLAEPTERSSWRSNPILSLENPTSYRTSTFGANYLKMGLQVLLSVIEEAV
jgi:hypothetical protein